MRYDIPPLTQCKYSLGSSSQAAQRHLDLRMRHVLEDRVLRVSGAATVRLPLRSRRHNPREHDVEHLPTVSVWFCPVHTCGRIFE